MLRATPLLSGIVLALGLCRIAAAMEPHLKYPRPCCPPNYPPGVGAYGYFPTTWRSWPCEERPEVTNPRSVGAEHLPTPSGQEQVPLPQATPLTQPGPSALRGGTQPAPGTAVPEPQPGGHAAPEMPGLPGGPTVPEGPATPGIQGLPGGPVTPPVEPKSEKKSATPLPEGGLPGLPVEPGPLPTPGSPKSSATPPALDLNPPTQPSQTTPKAAEAIPSQEKLQAKEAVKPNEPAKLPDLPKPSSTEKPSSGMRYEGTQPGGTAAASFEQPAEPRETAPPPRGNRPPQQKRELSAASRVEAITCNMPEPSPSAIKATTYKMPEPPITLEIIDRSAAERPVP